MGAYHSSFVIPPNRLVKKVKPTNPQWIFEHAEACGVPFSEVLRCWRRFVLLGPNKKGVLTQQSSIWQSEDKFVQQILRQLPWSKNFQLTFQVYIKVCQWFQNADATTKLKVAFGVLNQGQPLTSDILERILKHVYTDEEPETLKEMAENLVKQADTENTGSIDEEHFIEFAKRVPFEDFKPILEFSIIPIDLKNIDFSADEKTQLT